MVLPVTLLFFLSLTFYSVVDLTASTHLIELDQLRSVISTLETIINERAEELKRKDDSTKAMEKNIEQNLDYIASLNLQIQSLRGGSSDIEEGTAKMFDKSTELRSQADNLKNEIEAQLRKKNDLKVHTSAAEKKIKELYQKQGSLQKISDEQRTMISKIKHDIHFAEERLLKLKIETSLESEGSKQSYTILLWTEHGRSRLDWTIQKALDAKAIIQEWAAPLIEAKKKMWIPRMKQLWRMVIVHLEPHIVKFQNTANPYIQGFMQFLKPYLTQISVTSKPQFDIITHALKRHAREIIQIYENLMRSVMAYHFQVQGSIHELLKGHECTRAFADNDLVWYLASAIFALPAILVVNMYTSLVSYKPQKHRRVRRRAKRLHPELKTKMTKGPCQSG